MYNNSAIKSCRSVFINGVFKSLIGIVNSLSNVIVLVFSTLVTVLMLSTLLGMYVLYSVHIENSFLLTQFNIAYSKVV